MKGNGLRTEEVTAALNRVLAAGSLSRAPSLSALLRYIVEKAQSGRADEIKEYTIALEVFGRKSYDPQVHSHVRVEFGKLRKRLAEYYAGEGRLDPVRIEIPKGSYVPVFRAVAGDARPERRIRYVIAAAVLAGVVVLAAAVAVTLRPRPVTQTAGTLSIAVLPFEDLSPAKDGRELSDAITAELTARLAAVETLRVVSRATVLRAAGDRRDMRQLARRLGVHAFVEGSVRVEPERLNVTAQLTDTVSEASLWSEGFRHPRARSQEAPAAIASEIVTGFQRELKSLTRALVRPHSGKRDARHYYMRAARVALFEPFKASELYRAAVASDPEYALAWASVARTLLTAIDWGEGRASDLLPRASEAAARALALNPDLTEAHQAWAGVKIFAGFDWVEAEKAYRRSIQLDAANVDARVDYANLLLIPHARFGEAVTQLQQAIALNPEQNNFHNILAGAYIRAGEYGKAAAAIEASQKISATAPGAWVRRGMLAWVQGSAGEALKCFEHAVSRARTPFSLSHLGYAYAQVGRTDEALKIARELEAARAYEAAMVYAGLGDKDTAFAALDRAVANKELGVLWCKVDYRADALRSDSRMHAIVKRLRLE
jgi:TolB-like protein